MARLVDIAAAFLALSSAIALYGLKHDTRRIESRVQAQERTAEKTEREIAVLKAERAYLGRPERIEKLARAQGMEPVRERQYVRIDGSRDDGIARILDKPDIDALPSDDAEAPQSAEPGPR